MCFVFVFLLSGLKFTVSPEGDKQVMQLKKKHDGDEHKTNRCSSLHTLEKHRSLPLS